MPQKRNPDAAELVRGHSGRIIGCLTALMMTMKGLPLAYSKDMQDDKPPVFEAHDLLGLSIAAMTGMVESATFRTDRMRAAAEAGFCDRDRSCRLAGARGRHAVPRGASYHRPRGEAAPSSRAWRSTSCRSTICRRSMRESTSASMACCRSMPRSPAARAMAAPRRREVRKRDCRRRRRIGRRVHEGRDHLLGACAGACRLRQHADLKPPAGASRCRSRLMARETDADRRGAARRPTSQARPARSDELLSNSEERAATTVRPAPSD